MNYFVRTLFFSLFLITAFLSTAIVAQDSYTVTSLNDGGAYDDPDTGFDESSDGICDDGTGLCTLRAALEEAANRENSVIVNFGVSGTIGTTGDFMVPDNSQIIGNNRTITINSSGIGFYGDYNITITNIIIRVNSQEAVCAIGSNSTIKGVHILSGGVGIGVVDNCTIGGPSEQDRNVIGGCSVIAIEIGGNDNIVTGNYIGVNATGNVALANLIGIGITGGTGNIIGGGTPDKRNVISGNTYAGIMAAGTNITIQGNYIGIGADGVTNIPNGTGVQMQGTGMLGGDLPGERNVISNNQTGINLGEDEVGNSSVIVKGNFIGTDITGLFARGNNSAGINIGSAGHIIENNVISSNGTTGIGITSVVGASLSTDNVITGNKIGTDVSGLNPLPNAVGIIFQGPSNNNIVGEGLLAPYDGNTIAFNTGPGIYVDNQQAFGGIPEGNTFRKNRIFENGDLGIRIKTNAQSGILPPVIDSLKNDILYGHNARPDARIDVYEAEPDPSGSGEGKTWIANGTAIGDGSFEVPISNNNCFQLTATQTDINGNTSEFSANLNLDPEIKNLDPNCPQTFLVGVSLVNPFTATLDWKGVPEEGRSVTFNLNGNVHPGILSGDIATTTYDMGNISVDINTLTITASSCAGNAPDFIYQVCGTAVPEWAAPAGSIISTGTSCDAIYTKVFLFPNPAIIPDMPFIENIPFIGGALGFLTTQGKVSLKASTAGGTLQSTDVLLNTKFNLAGESFNLDVSGTTNTTLNCLSLDLIGSLTATVNVSHTYSWGTDLSSMLPLECPSIPVLGEICQSARAISNLVSLGAEVGGSIGITANYEAVNGVEFTGGSGSGTISIRPFINVFPFSAEGTGRMTLEVVIPSFDTHGQLSFDFTVSAGDWHRTFGPYIWTSAVTSGVFIGIDKAEPINSLRDINSLDNASLVKIVGDDTLVISEIPADGNPVLAVGSNDKRVLTWSHFGIGAGRPSGDIGVKIFNGTSWGENIFLTADVQVDQNPEAAFDDAGHIIICWERNLTTNIPADTAIYDPIFLQGFNIQYAILDAANGNVQNSGSFGEFGKYDFLPKLSKGIDGNILLVWETTSGNTIFGNTSDPASLTSARWNGSAWGTPVVISSSLKGVHNWEMANRNNDTSLVSLALDTDDDLSTYSDWEVFASLWDGGSWSSLIRLTNDVSFDWGVHCAYDGDGHSVIGWLKDSSVVGISGDISQNPSLWLSDTNKVRLDFTNGKLASGAGKILLAWPDAGNISYFTAEQSALDWSQHLSFGVMGDEKSLSVAVDENGLGMIGYLRVPLRSNGNSLSDSADYYIKTIDLGSIINEVIDEESKIPGCFVLQQNYPNPFNPTTTIRYSIPQRSNVSLKVFDVLGNEVATLVNVEKPAGDYEINFNASQLSSGIYFYKLQASSFVETRKMILMK